MFQNVLIRPFIVTSLVDAADIGSIELVGIKCFNSAIYCDILIWQSLMFQNLLIRPFIVTY